MLLRSVVLLISSVLFAGAVNAGNEVEDQFYFAVAQAMKNRADTGEALVCDESVSILLAEEQQRKLRREVTAMVLDDYAVYLRGNVSVIGSFIEALHQKGLLVDLVAAMDQKRVGISQNQLTSRVDPRAWLPDLFGADPGGIDVSQPGLAEYLACSIVSILYGDEYLASEIAEIQEFYEGISASSSVGYFDVELKSCRVTNQLNTGNRFANPEPWEGSRFLVLDVTFKNKDKESRIPLPGSALISVDGSIYEFDQPESIMARGYGVPLQGINPLVTYRTKLVYRVPDESFSDVFWQPGRNSEGKRLYCSL